MDNKRILLIDDEPDLVRLTSFRLQKAGYDILVAESGTQGLQIAQQEKPDLILLDLNLPHMNGDKVCQAIKSDPDLRHIPIIVLSASSESIKKKSEEIGADAYIVKPFEVSNLLETIKKFV
jgi:CheY-like chemotaxis protein